MPPSQNLPEKPARSPVTSTSFAGRFRTYFLAGIVVTAPIAITLWASYWFVTLFDAWLRPLIPAFLDPGNYLPFRVPGIGLIFALLGITLTWSRVWPLDTSGGTTKHAVLEAVAFPSDPSGLVLESNEVMIMFRSDSLATLDDVKGTLFSSSGNAFREAVLVQYPREGSWTIAFVTGRPGGEVADHLDPDRYVSVYVPTTPNPTSGYVYFVDVDDVRIIDMPVEDAAKLVISMGLVFPEGAEQVKVIAANIDQNTAQKLLEKPAKKPPSRKARTAKAETAAK